MNWTGREVWGRCEGGVGERSERGAGQNIQFHLTPPSSQTTSYHTPLPLSGHWKLKHTPTLFAVNQMVLLISFGLFTFIRSSQVSHSVA